MITKLSDELKNELLKMKPEDFSVPWITMNFTKTADAKGNIRNPRYKPTDVVILKAHEYLNNSEIQTTAGRILFNKLFIEGKVDNIIGYFNKVLTKKEFKKLINRLADAMMDGKCTTHQYAMFIQAFEFYTLKLASSFSPSFDEAILRPNPEIQKIKEKRLSEINADSSLTSAQKQIKYSELEKELTAMSRNDVEGDPSLALFDSGARGDFDVEYKVMNIMGGLVPNTEEGQGQYTFMASNYIDGVDKQDIPKAGNIVVGASYPRAVATAVGGYMTKQFYSVYQAIQLDEPGSNCGSKFTLSVLLNPKQAALFRYQYMVIDGKNVCLTPDIEKEYYGKVVQFRTPMGCLGDKICHVCAGDRFRRLNITNIGLTTGRISNGIMDKNMQAFHQTKVTYDQADPDNLLI